MMGRPAHRHTCDGERRTLGPVEADDAPVLRRPRVGAVRFGRSVPAHFQAIRRPLLFAAERRLLRQAVVSADTCSGT